MDAVVHNLAEIESVGIEDGIVDVVADLRGSRGAVTMEGYDRYIGRRDLVEGVAFPVCPAGTVADPVPSHLLDVAVADDGSWAVLPRAGFVWEDVRELVRWDIRQMSVVALLRPPYADEICRRVVDASRCLYQIPRTMRCDRNFLGDAVDWLYVKETSARLFEGMGRFPVM